MSLTKLYRAITDADQAAFDASHAYRDHLQKLFTETAALLPADYQAHIRPGVMYVYLPDRMIEVASNRDTIELWSQGERKKILPDPVPTRLATAIIKEMNR
jgi:hypothetical protein